MFRFREGSVKTVVVSVWGNLVGGLNCLIGRPAALSLVLTRRLIGLVARSQAPSRRYLHLPSGSTSLYQILQITGVGWVGLHAWQFNHDPETE